MTHQIIKETVNMKPLDALLHNILTFIYFLAHQIGSAIVKVIQSIFSETLFPDTIIDPLGFLIILSLFMLLAGIAKKIAWIIIAAAWILLFVRILMIIFKIG